MRLSSSFILHPSSFRAPRAGLTILEVLISIFVLAVGILSLTALIPLAQVQVSDAAALDRAAALGRAAFRDLQIRGYLNPNVWAFYDPTVTPDQPEMVATSGGGGGFGIPVLIDDTGPERSFAPPFVIDPLALSHPANLPGAGTVPPTYRFPYGTGTAAFPANPPLLLRFTIETTPWLPTTLAEQQRRFALAERIFRSNDDLVLNRPKDATLRPTLGFARTTGATAVPLKDSSNGRLSWFATVSPSIHEIVYGTSLNDLGPREYLVSVVVVQNRDLVANTAAPALDSYPAERMLLADIVSGGQSGGEIILKYENGAPAKRTWMTCQPGQWIMLSAYVTDPSLPRIDPAVPATQVDMNQAETGFQRVVLSWFRIRAVQDVDLEDTTVDERRLTVEGPDWDVFANNVVVADRFVDADTDANWPTAYATLVTGAIAVYQKAMRFEGRSPYAN